MARKTRRKVARKTRRQVARKTRGNVARRTSCWRRCSWPSCCASRRRRLHRRRSPDCPAYGQRPCSVVPWWRGSGVVSQARAHEQQQHAHTHPAFHFSHGSPFFSLQPEQLPHLGLRMWLGTMNETQANEPLRRALPWEPETGVECDVHEKPSEDGCVHVDALAAVELGGEHGVSHCVSHCGLNARWCRGYRQLPRAGWRA